MNHVDVVIISWAKTPELKNVTEEGLKTLFESEDPNEITFHAYVVESNKEVNYNGFQNTTTIYTDNPFGYHRYLNIGRKHGTSEFVVLCNNDLTYEKGWATQIISLMRSMPELLSASPFCPQIHHPDHKKYAIIFGYEIRFQMSGWCIFQQRKIYDIIGDLDEDFEFWFCDNDYAMTLMKHKITHGLAPQSVVNHHANFTGTSQELVDSDKLNELTWGQSEKFNNKWKEQL